MAPDDRDILDILRFELRFLEDGGYGRSPHAAWRAPAIFEDSPICPNFCDPARPHPCESCLLEQFVPDGQKKESIPCRFIPLTQEGQTVNAVQSAPTMVVLGKVETMTVRSEISEADVVRCRPGQKVYFTILGDPNRRYEGRLAYIEPAPESVKSDSSFSSISTPSPGPGFFDSPDFTVTSSKSGTPALALLRKSFATVPLKTFGPQKSRSPLAEHSCE